MSESSSRKVTPEEGGEPVEDDSVYEPDLDIDHRYVLDLPSIAIKRRASPTSHRVNTHPIIKLITLVSTHLALNRQRTT
jgi:hypothetical protein